MSLTRFELRQSADAVKRDLELVCKECGKHLCDAEPGDTLEVLVAMTDDHVCGKGEGEGEGEDDLDDEG